MNVSTIPRYPHSRFFSPHGAAACRGTAVFFHGFTGVPEELDSLAAALSADGWRVILPCLSGHGRDVTSLQTTRATAWLEDAARVASYIAKQHGRVLLGGLSFGSLIALCVSGALKPEKVSGVVLLAPPFKLRGPDWLIRLLSYLPDSILDSFPTIKKHPRPEGTFILPRLSFTEYPLGTVARMVQVRRVATTVGKILRAPMLVLVDPDDHIIDPQAIDTFCHQNETAAIDQLFFEGGQHELTLCKRYEEVAATVANFGAELCRAR